MNIRNLFDPMKVLAALDCRDKDMLSPISVEIQPTNLCNLSCRYCSYKKRRINNESINDDLLRNLCNELINMNVRAVYFSGGGEPTLHPGLKKAIDSLHKNSIDIALITNGQEKEKVLEVAPKCKYILLHSVMDMSVLIGKRKEEKDLVSVIKSQSPDTIVGTRIVIDEFNSNNLLPLVQRLLEKDYDYIQCTPAVDFETGKEYISQERLEKLSQDIAKIENERIIFGWKPSFDTKFDGEYCQSLTNFLFTQIMADGSVSSCPNIVEEIKIIGNINKQSFKEIWGSAKHQEFIKCYHQNIKCTGCRFLSYNRILLQRELQKNSPHMFFL